MIIDNECLMSNKQTIASTARSSNVIDLGAMTLGTQGKENIEIDVLVQVTTTFTTSDSATLTVTLCTDSDETISNGTVLCSSATLAAATLVEGYQIAFSKVPVNTLQYMDINYTVGTGTFTAGKITAALVLDRHTNIR